MPHLAPPGDKALAAPAMWNVYYTHKGTAALISVSTLDGALDRACELLDQGAVVGGIADDVGTKQISITEIKRYHAACRPKKPG